MEVEITESNLKGDVSARPTMFCTHCEQYLAKSTFYRHRRKFYNPITKTWEKHKKTTVLAEKTSVTDHCSMEQDMDMQVASDIIDLREDIPTPLLDQEIGESHVPGEYG